MKYGTVMIILVAWWFGLIYGTGRGRVVGPFRTQAECESMRNAFGKVETTPCWAGEARG